MIISEQKPFQEILTYINKEDKIFVLGCAGCAQASQTGGLTQVLEMNEKLSEEGKNIVGFCVCDFLCQKALVASRLKPHEDEIMGADSLLVMTCGIGVQVVASTVKKPVHPACNSIPLGGIRGEWQGSERCLECGDCVLEYTGGICPMTACSKRLLNGACGGASKGKCEVSKHKPCGWELIYERLKGLGKLDTLKVYLKPKEYNKMRPKWEIMSTAIWAIENNDSP